MSRLTRCTAVLGILVLSFSAAQVSAVPKLDLKAFVGVGTTTTVARLPSFELPSGVVPGRETLTFFSWQGGLSARVRSRHVFGEVGLVFSRFQFTIDEVLREISVIENPGDPSAQIPESLVGARAKLNSLDLPLTAGYIPYANPYFKLFLYGGLVNKFNIRAVIRDGSRRGLHLRPKEIPGYPIVIYQAGFRLGTAFDLGPTNFDFNYTIGLNSLTKTVFRTNSHVFQFNVGWLF